MTRTEACIALRNATYTLGIIGVLRQLRWDENIEKLCGSADDQLERAISDLERVVERINGAA